MSQDNTPSPADRRQSRRVPITNLKVMVREYLLEFPAKDLSFEGIGFPHMSWPVNPTEDLTLDVIYNGRAILAEVPARIVRKDDQVVGCRFLALSPEQRDAIECLVLLTF